MGSRLFDHVSVEEIDQTVVDDVSNYGGVALALDNNFNGIDFAIEQISVLTKLKNILLKNKDKKLSKSSLKIGKLAIENISRSLKMQDDFKTVSVEAFSEDSDINVAVESIMETIKKIWKSIVDTFKAIWAKIISFFSSNKPRSDNDVSKARRTEKNINDIKDEIKRNEIVLPEMPEVTLATYTEALNYLNCEITDEKLLDHISRVKKLGDDLKAFINEVETTHSLINSQIEAISPVVDEDPVGASFIAQANDRQFNVGLLNYMASLPSVTDDQKDVRKLLNSVIENSSSIDSHSVRIIDGFNFGGAICFYKIIDNDNQFNYHIKVFDKCNVKDNKVTLKVPDLSNIGLFANNITSLASLAKDLNSHSTDKINSIKKIHTSIIYFLDSNQKHIGVENEDIMLSNFKTIKQITSSILSLSSNATKAFDLYFNTVHYFVELNEYFKNYYEKTVKEALA